MKYKVTLNGRTYEVEVEKGKAVLLDEYEAMAPKSEPVVEAVSTPVAAPQAAAPAASSAEASADAIVSPLPGTILSIRANAGTAVKEGDVVLIIEAMKMENEITAPKAGTVTKVYVNAGVLVDTGAPLFEIG